MILPADINIKLRFTFKMMKIELRLVRLSIASAHSGESKLGADASVLASYPDNGTRVPRNLRARYVSCRTLKAAIVNHASSYTPRNPSKWPPHHVC